MLAGLVGLRSAFGDLLGVNPLATGLDYFAVDNVLYHGHNISVAWDETGTRAYKGCPKGLCAFVDGKVAGTSPTLKKLQLQLPKML